MSNLFKDFVSTEGRRLCWKKFGSGIGDPIVADLCDPNYEDDTPGFRENGSVASVKGPAGGPFTVSITESGSKRMATADTIEEAVAEVLKEFENSPKTHPTTSAAAIIMELTGECAHCGGVEDYCCGAALGIL